MKITVRHLGTEIEVYDNQAMDDNRGLLYYNDSYSLRLLEKIVQQIRLLHLEEGGDK